MTNTCSAEQLSCLSLVEIIASGCSLAFCNSSDYVMLNLILSLCCYVNKPVTLPQVLTKSKLLAIQRLNLNENRVTDMYYYGALGPNL